ncbi:hypothetical protein BRADI_3g51315v3 [Brachypodium distachyon]|uniref:Uncharacterized protein n=1 Tax=Brachypodium distachyon TaxID=15368 RepID=A0A2K2D4K4_BRADI|nr:hypothetical protein BRADI_3g51315v3 [Brachypodium distachyon]
MPIRISEFLVTVASCLLFLPPSRQRAGAPLPASFFLNTPLKRKRKYRQQQKPQQGPKEKQRKQKKKKRRRRGKNAFGNYIQGDEIVDLCPGDALHFMCYPSRTDPMTMRLIQWRPWSARHLLHCALFDRLLHLSRAYLNAYRYNEYVRSMNSSQPLVLNLYR